MFWTSHKEDKEATESQCCRGTDGLHSTALCRPFLYLHSASFGVKKMRESLEPQITLYRCKSVLEKTGLKRSSLYKLIHLGTFPKPIKITAKAVAWPSNEVEDWIKNRILSGQQNVTEQNFAVSLKGAK